MTGLVQRVRDLLEDLRLKLRKYLSEVRMFRFRRKCSHVLCAHNVLPSTRCEKLARSQHARYTGRSSLLLQILCKSIDLDICTEVDMDRQNI